jgi:putative DNA-invertase from lambdoid prophage Rac
VRDIIELSGKRVAGYCRVSTMEQAEYGESLEAQSAMISSYCESRGLTLCSIYTDAGVSGGVPLGERPEGAHLVEDVERRRVHGVVSARLDRLFRSVADCALRTDAWRRHGIDLHLLDLNIDTSTAIGEAFVAIAAVFAQLERRLTQERIQAVMDRKKLKGELVGSPPYGKRVAEDGKTLIDDESEQAIITEIVSARADGLSYSQILDLLTRSGAPPRGSRWHTTSIVRILQRATRKPGAEGSSAAPPA